jgi:hypothetical protein
MSIRKRSRNKRSARAAALVLGVGALIGSFVTATDSASAASLGGYSDCNTYNVCLWYGTSWTAGGQQFTGDIWNYSGYGSLDNNVESVRNWGIGSYSQVQFYDIGGGSSPQFCLHDGYQWADIAQYKNKPSAHVWRNTC